ncbi:unnamed protein product [Polarella glacialis]|uniref:Uncharacterized protein n=1 Tax=Polarella glacialis TaxID=89957 RepID=A0A813DBJ5_POLGL|nr:unnamed protein product [Polarella glacialis]
MLGAMLLSRPVTSSEKQEDLLSPGFRQDFSKKMSSAKQPLRLIFMQLATSRSRKGLQLNLDWRPRGENQEADDLTNRKFEDFAEEHRVNFTWEEVGKGLIDKLLICQGEYEVELAALKSRAAAVAVEGPMSKRRNKDVKTVCG